MLNAAAGLLLDGTYQFRPFWTPAPVSDYWYLLLFPLCIALAVVYKSIKCAKMRDVPREATQILLMILGGIILAAILLAVLTRWIERP